MDYYNNYYEELYHAGFFSALRGRIREGHKWLTRTGTPGHYVYTYAKKIGQSAGRLFGSRNRNEKSYSRKEYRSNNGNKRSDDGEFHYPEYTYGDKQRRRSENQSMSQRDAAQQQKREDRFIDKVTPALNKRAGVSADAKLTYDPYTGKTSAGGYATNGPLSKVGHVTVDENGRVKTDRKAIPTVTYQDKAAYKNGSIGYTRRTDSYTKSNQQTIKTAPNANRAEKSTADRIKEWGANTLSSIRKTANDAAGAVSKGYESAKNWINDLQKKARGTSWNNVDLKNGHAGLTGSKPKGWDEYYNSAKNRETGKDRPNVRANASHNTKENRHLENVKRELRELAIEDHNQRQAARTGDALLSLANSNNRNFDEWKPSKSGRVVSTTTDKKGTVTKKFGDGNVLEYDSKPVTVSNMDEWRKKYYEPAMSGTNSNKKRRRTSNR